MSSSFGKSVPPGQFPPFAIITPSDHTAWIIISAALGLAVTLVFAGIRVFIRTTSNYTYDVDDYLVAVATVHAGIVEFALSNTCADDSSRSGLQRGAI